ncbi:unnamed protein product [Lepidochelys kempii]
MLTPPPQPFSPRRPLRAGPGQILQPAPATWTPPGTSASPAGVGPGPATPHGTLEAQRQRKSRRKSKEQLAVLKSFFLRCQWARREDYQWLERITGLPRAEIIQWFGDTRYALKHGHLRWFWDNTVPPAAALEPRGPARTRARWSGTGPPGQQLRQDDLPALCRESGMGAQQVLNWFYSRSPEPAEVVVCLGEEPEDEDEEAGLMVQDDGEEEEDEPEEEDLGRPGMRSFRDSREGGGSGEPTRALGPCSV